MEQFTGGNLDERLEQRKPQDEKDAINLPFCPVWELL
jgi:hypothetical protein